MNLEDFFNNEEKFIRYTAKELYRLKNEYINKEISKIEFIELAYDLIDLSSINRVPIEMKNKLTVINTLHVLEGVIKNII